jgi:RNA polymerase sigma factor (sigma-70 family)
MHPMKDQDDAVWSAYAAAMKSRTGEEDRQKALADLYRRTKPRGLGFARKLIGGAASRKLRGWLLDPEDICNQAYLDLHRCAARLENPRKWFYNKIVWIVLGIIHQELPALENEPALIEHERAINAEPQRISAKHLNLIRHLRKAVRTLPPRARRIVWGHYYEDKSLDDLATLFRISPASVRRTLCRAAKRIEAFLRDRGIC